MLTVNLANRILAKFIIIHCSKNMQQEETFQCCTPSTCSPSTLCPEKQTKMFYRWSICYKTRVILMTFGKLFPELICSKMM